MLRNNIVLACVDILGISRPYSVKIISKTKKDTEAEYIARYSEKHKRLTHDIRVYLGENTRPLESLIAHEFIHAWQEEKGLTEIHGKYFRKIARELEEAFNLPDIYIKGIDK